jgi:hypothetical protein
MVSEQEERTMQKAMMEYDSYSKCYRVSEGSREIGKVYSERGSYTAYLDNKYVGIFRNPYTAKNAISDTLHPEQIEQREKTKEQKEKAAEEKRIAKEEERKREKEQHDITVSKMNAMRENQTFREAFYTAFCAVQPEYATAAKDDVFSWCRIGMNGICLNILDGQQAINRSIKNGGTEGKIMRILLDSGTIAQLQKGEQDNGTANKDS